MFLVSNISMIRCIVISYTEKKSTLIFSSLYLYVLILLPMNIKEKVILNRPPSQMFQEKQKKVQLARLILKHLLKKNYTIEFSFTHTVRYIAASQLCDCPEPSKARSIHSCPPILATTYSMKSNTTIEFAEAMTKDMAIVYYCC